MGANNPISWLTGLLFPPQCFVCGSPLPLSREYLCVCCEAGLARSGYAHDANPIGDLMLSVAGGRRGTAWLRYEPGNSVASVIHDFKYRGFPRLARHMGRMAAGALRDAGIFAGVDLLLPVPLHRSKERRRGYNQAAMIARGISRATGISVGRQLVALRSHDTQTRLSAAERRANVAGIFGVRHPETLGGRHVLIVDDVFTTGATMLSAADTLAACGAPGLTISYLALATAHS